MRKSFGYRPEFYALGFFGVVAVVFYGSLAWTGVISFTSSKLLPSYAFVGFDQYVKLIETPRWQTACTNLIILGVAHVALSLTFGTLLAVLLDQKVRFESIFRTAFLYPLAISLVVTGLSWRWLFDPATGFPEWIRGMGWTSFQFDWLVNTDHAIYTVAIASVWHATGLIMIIMLAGLRGVEEDLWKAIAVEGIPRWRAYLQVVLPSLRPMFASCFVLLSADVIRSYDLVIALTRGGPGFSTDVPAKFAVDNYFGRANIGLASAASILMLLIVLVPLAPYFFAQSRRKTQ